MKRKRRERSAPRAHQEHDTGIRLDSEAAAAAAAREIARGNVAAGDKAAIEQAAMTARFARAAWEESDPRLARLLEPLVARTQSNGRDLLTDIALSNGLIELEDYVTRAGDHALALPEIGDDPSVRP
ncbi:hypothetical protein GCM10027070_25460 [Barrientosiimonas humi]